MTGAAAYLSLRWRPPIAAGAAPGPVRLCSHDRRRHRCQRSGRVPNALPWPGVVRGSGLSCVGLVRRQWSAASPNRSATSPTPASRPGSWSALTRRSPRSTRWAAADRCSAVPAWRARSPSPGPPPRPESNVSSTSRRPPCTTGHPPSVTSMSAPAWSTTTLATTQWAGVPLPLVRHAGHPLRGTAPDGGCPSKADQNLSRRGSRTFPRMIRPCRMGVAAWLAEGSPGGHSVDAAVVCGGSLLDEIVRDGARAMLAAALRAEVAASLQSG